MTTTFPCLFPFPEAAPSLFAIETNTPVRIIKETGWGFMAALAKMGETTATFRADWTF